jgi:sporulation integral membrane protein YlbJ
MGAARKGISWGDATSAVLTLAACILLLWDPEDAIKGGLQGLEIFGEIVLPSLLPFFVVSEILIGLGVVHFLGALVEPLMRPVFNVPGTGSFVWSMGLAAGYPMDAVITTKLRQTNDCTRVEGERLLAFTNTADPLFILGAVAVGMFGLPAVGFHLAAAHYAAAITVGVLFRFYGRRDPAESAHRHERTNRHDSGGYWAHAWQEMERARKQDGRAFGRLLADAMTESTLTLVKIGGFIMFFAALIQLMDSTGMLQLVGVPISGLLGLLKWDQNLTPGLMAGALELDVGSAMVAEVSAPLLQRLAAVSAIVAWSGLSVHGQVASIISVTDLRMGAYLKARLLHALLAASYTIMLFLALPPLTTAMAGTLTALAFSPLFRAGLACGMIGVAVLGGITCRWLQRRRY